jgi:hypothetical protein
MTSIFSFKKVLTRLRAEIVYVQQPFISIANLDAEAAVGWVVNYLNEGGKLTFAKYPFICLGLIMNQLENLTTLRGVAGSGHR